MEKKRSLTAPQKQSADIKKKRNGLGRFGRKGRPEPVGLEVQNWFTAAAPGFPATRSSIIPMLQSAQASFGYVPCDAMRVIGRHVGVPAAMVNGVASFYAQFRFAKPGRHRLTVCRGTACHVRGSGQLMKDLERDLDVAAGGTTADGQFTLEAVSCFGACALAPVVVVNGNVNGRVNATSLKVLVDNIDNAAIEPRNANSEA